MAFLHISTTKDALQLEEICLRLTPFIRMKLQQFRVDDFYQANDVLHECFLRLEKKLDSKEEIPNLIGWLRVTSLNIIREHARRRSRERFISIDSVADTLSSSETASDIERSEEYRYLRAAFLQLPVETQELLAMRFVHNWSWNEISEFYNKHGQEVSAATLRQRQARALRLLRQHFNDSMNQSKAEL